MRVVDYTHLSRWVDWHQNPAAKIYLGYHFTIAIWHMKGR